MTNWYKHGLEPTTDVDGWSVFSEAEGDDPKFVAFFVLKEQAEAFLTLRHQEDTETPLVFEPAVELAVATEDYGIVTANDYTIDNHKQLRDRIARVRREQTAN